MSSWNLVKLGALGAMLGGSLWIASGIVSAVITSGRGPEALGSAFLDEMLYIIALVGTLGGITGLHARQAPGYGWLGTMGFLAAFIGIQSKAQKSQKRCPLKCHISIVMMPVRAAPANVIAIGFIGLSSSSGDSAVGTYERYRSYRSAATRVS